MLDLTKLARQIQGISDHLSKEADAARRRVEIAQGLMNRAIDRQDVMVSQLEEWRGGGASLNGNRLLFAAAEPIEALNTRIALDTAPAAHSVISSDGSQISPSHHEIAYCSTCSTLAGSIIHYGQSRYPFTRQPPRSHLPPQDLYASRKWGIRTEEWMGYKRTAAEAIMLSELGTEATGSQDSDVPILAMTDGSLIYWFLEQIPAKARDEILLPVLESWEQMRKARVPVMGYISASRSGEALNFLRLQACPFDTPDCISNCEHQRNETPCNTFAPLRDVTLWATTLQPGERGPLWKSSADILSCYGEHAVYFCYVHVGAEIARVEFPKWVVEDRELLDTALSLMPAQVQKGFGCPVRLWLRRIIRLL